MHNNTNSTYFSHFWSNIKRNKWQNKRTPILFSEKSSAHTDTAAFSRRTTTRRTTNDKKSVALLHTLEKCSIVQLNAPKLTTFAFDAITRMLYGPWRSLSDHTWHVTIAARYTRFRHANGIFPIKTTILHTCARKFWYFPLLKHDIHKKINKLKRHLARVENINNKYAAIYVYIKTNKVTYKWDLILTYEYRHAIYSNCMPIFIC